MNLDIPALRQELDLLDGEDIPLDLGLDVGSEGLGQVAGDHRAGVRIDGTGHSQGGSHLDVVVDEELEVARVDEAGPLLDDLDAPGLGLLRTAALLFTLSLNIPMGNCQRRSCNK